MRKKIIDHIRKIQAKAEGRSVWDRMLLSGYYSYRAFKVRLRQVDDPRYNRVYLKTRRLKRNLTGKKFNFVSVDLASYWTLEWIKTFPERYDLVVGVPRSGMFIASLIALKLGKGLTTPELLVEGKYWHSNFVKDRAPITSDTHVLLVDDAMDTGRAMTRAMQQIRSVNSDIKVSRACLIVREEAIPDVDLYFKVIPAPRVYEWNILHRKIASYWGHGRLAVDMDGVLCANCPPGVDQDEKLYLEWITAANPYLIPAFEIDAIVTSRLEKYREATEDWLRKHNVLYKKLYMWDVASKDERKGKFAKYKIDELLRIKPDMFWESSAEQSEAIWKKTGIPTLCIDTMNLLA